MAPIHKHHQNVTKTGMENEYNDYEDDRVEDEIEDEERVVELKPSKDMLMFLKIREKLKEKYRLKLKKQNANSFDHSSQSPNRKRTSTNDNFGSFFGPSQAVIASPVLDEFRSIRETRHITSKLHGFSVRASSRNMLHGPHQQPKVKVVKTKAQILREMRDYSSLLSDDVDLPNKNLPAEPCHISEPMPAQTSLEGKDPVSKPLKFVKSGPELKMRTPTSTNIKPKVPMNVSQLSRPLPSYGEPRLTKVNGRITVTKKRNANDLERIPLKFVKACHDLKLTTSTSTKMRPKMSMNQLSRLLPLHGEPRLTKIDGRVTVTKKRNANDLERKPLKFVKAFHDLKLTTLTSTNLRPKVSMNVPQLSRPLPSYGEPRLTKVDGRVTATKKRDANDLNRFGSQTDLSTSKPYSSTQNINFEHKRASQVAGQPAPKQAPPLKSQLTSKAFSSGAIMGERRKESPIKRRFDEDSAAYAIQLIRNMFRYDPRKYAGMEDDDSAMEVGFSEILREERRSTKIARKEDAEQLQLINEEERRERMRKKQKLK